METNEKIDGIITTVNNTNVFSGEAKEIIIKALNNLKGESSSKTGKSIKDMSEDELDTEINSHLDAIKDLADCLTEKNDQAGFFAVYSKNHKQHRSVVIGKDIAIEAGIGCIYLNNNKVENLLTRAVGIAIQTQVMANGFKSLFNHGRES